MSCEKRLIDGNGRYTLHASDNTDYRLLFRNGIICVENELGHCVCEFYADDAPTVDAAEVVHSRWIANRICSNCRKELTEWAAQNGYLYCPHCGAKMDGEDIGV